MAHHRNTQVTSDPATTNRPWKVIRQLSPVNSQVAHCRHLGIRDPKNNAIATMIQSITDATEDDKVVVVITRHCNPVSKARWMVRRMQFTTVDYQIVVRICLPPPQNELVNMLQRHMNMRVNSEQDSWIYRSPPW